MNNNVIAQVFARVVHAPIMAYILITLLPALGYQAIPFMALTGFILAAEAIIMVGALLFLFLLVCLGGLMGRVVLSKEPEQ